MSSTSALGKRLADTDAVTRNRSLKKFVSAIKEGSGSIEKLEEFLRIWRGLWYGLWMADKRPVQQQVAVEAVSVGMNLNDKQFIVWVRAFYQTLVELWPKLDRYRMDKYLLLLRVFVAETFRRMRVSGWEVSFIEEISEEIVKAGSKCIGVTLQMMRVWWEELSAELSRSEKSVEMKVFIKILSVPISFATTSSIESVVRRSCEDVLSSDHLPVNLAKTIAKQLKAKAMLSETDQDCRVILYDTAEVLLNRSHKKKN